MLDLFDELAAVVRALEGAKIRYALVGGLAYSIWVETRATEDIDLLIRSEDWERIPPLLAPLGFSQLAMPMDIGKTKIRRLTKLSGEDALVLDFLFADGSFAAGIERSSRISHRGCDYDLAPPDVIIEMKQERMSAKDKSDIEGLRRLLEERKE